MATNNVIATFFTLLVLTFFHPKTLTASQNFTAILVFGDSTMDTGNNNYVRTFLKANFPPYGQDFPGHVATGRFSNGKLMPDFIAIELGIKQAVPPFLDPTLPDEELATGVDFASAGSGYDNLTTTLTNVVPVSKQMEHFKEYIARLEGVVGKEKAKEIIGNALVILSAGTNDWTLNFYDIPTRELRFDVSGYQDFLQGHMQFFVMELYDLGCRTFLVYGLPPIGCLPIQLALAGINPFDASCVEDQNSDSQSYNAKLVKLLPQLQAKLPGSKIVYADIYTPVLDMIDHPEKYGFVDVKRGCCGENLPVVSYLCNPSVPLCSNSSEFLFWDFIHPTQAAYQYLVKYLGNTTLPKLF